MKKIKSVLAYTNPFGWFAGICVFVGIVISSMFYSTFKNTSKVIKSLKEE